MLTKGARVAYEPTEWNSTYGMVLPSFFLLMFDLSLPPHVRERMPVERTLMASTLTSGS